MAKKKTIPPNAGPQEGGVAFAPSTLTQEIGISQLSTDEAMLAVLMSPLSEVELFKISMLFKTRDFNHLFSVDEINRVADSCNRVRDYVNYIQNAVRSLLPAVDEPEVDGNE